MSQSGTTRTVVIANTVIRVLALPPMGLWLETLLQGTVLNTGYVIHLVVEYQDTLKIGQGAKLTATILRDDPAQEKSV